MKNKSDLSISLSPEIIESLKIKSINRTKFIEKCIKNEIYKSSKK